ncbi:hypothetical protein PINS_up003487 [Pythium insidiosum]|nr:hypothetical protein PINS_up003487 [Pythium insidiosum]
MSSQTPPSPAQPQVISNGAVDATSILRDEDIRRLLPSMHQPTDAERSTLNALSWLFRLLEDFRPDIERFGFEATRVRVQTALDVAARVADLEHRVHENAFLSQEAAASQKTVIENLRAENATLRRLLAGVAERARAATTSFELYEDRVALPCIAAPAPSPHNLASTMLKQFPRITVMSTVDMSATPEDVLARIFGALYPQATEPEAHRFEPDNSVVVSIVAQSKLPPPPPVDIPYEKLGDDLLNPVRDFLTQVSAITSGPTPNCNSVDECESAAAASFDSPSDVLLEEPRGRAAAPTSATKRKLAFADSRDMTAAAISEEVEGHTIITPKKRKTLVTAKPPTSQLQGSIPGAVTVDLGYLASVLQAIGGFFSQGNSVIATDTIVDGLPVSLLEHSWGFPRTVVSSKSVNLSSRVSDEHLRTWVSTQPWKHFTWETWPVQHCILFNPQSFSARGRAWFGRVLHAQRRFAREYWERTHWVVGPNDNTYVRDRKERHKAFRSIYRALVGEWVVLSRNQELPDKVWWEPCLWRCPYDTARLLTPSGISSGALTLAEFIEQEDLTSPVRNRFMADLVKIADHVIPEDPLPPELRDQLLAHHRGERSGWMLPLEGGVELLRPMLRMTPSTRQGPFAWSFALSIPLPLARYIHKHAARSMEALIAKLQSEHLPPSETRAATREETDVSVNNSSRRSARASAKDATAKMALETQTAQALDATVDLIIEDENRRTAPADTPTIINREGSQLARLSSVSSTPPRSPSVIEVDVAPPDTDQEEDDDDEDEILDRLVASAHQPSI